MSNILYKLLLGKPEYNFRLPSPAIKNQCLIIKRIWNNEDHNDIGLEKLLRLFLASIQFVFPAIYMRHLLWKAGFIWQSIAIETYVLLKTIFPFFLLYTGLYSNGIFLGILIYLLIESLCYISALIFLTDQLAKSRSYRRSILLLIIDYIMIAGDFAVIYGGFGLIGEKSKNIADTIYFSFVTSATIGYGDIVPTTAFGKFMVCFQSVIFLVFVVLVISFFTSRFGSEHKDFYDIQREKQNKEKEV